MRAAPCRDHLRFTRAAARFFPRLALDVVLGAGLVLAVFHAAPALAQKTGGEPATITGRIVAGQDKVFIKDAEGYCLIEGLDLAPYSGRNIQAKVLVIRKDQEYRLVRLLDYRILCPDDDSPGAGGTVRQTIDAGKKK